MFIQTLFVKISLKSFFFDFFLYLLVIIWNTKIIPIMLFHNIKFTFFHQRSIVRKWKVFFLKNLSALETNRLQIRFRHAKKPLHTHSFGDPLVRTVIMNKNVADFTRFSCIFAPWLPNRVNNVPFYSRNRYIKCK